MRSEVGGWTTRASATPAAGRAAGATGWHERGSDSEPRGGWRTAGRREWSAYRRARRAADPPWPLALVYDRVRGRPGEKRDVQKIEQYGPFR